MSDQKLNPEQTLAMLKAGARTRDVAQAQGVSHQRISQLRKRWGIPSASVTVPLDRAKALRLLAKGLTDREAGVCLGVSPHRVRRLRRAMGLPTIFERHEALVQAAHAQHGSMRAIARAVGLPLQTVRDICRRLGLRSGGQLRKVGRRSS